MTLESEWDTDEWKWPSEEAERAKLYVPNDSFLSHETSRSERRTCVFRFDSDQRLLTVALDSDGEDHVIDVIDPQDIIGVNVEIKMMDPDESHLFHAEEQSNIQSAADNEPASDTPFDTKATAVLSLYVYPKGKPAGARDSIFRFCGAERSSSNSSAGAEIICKDTGDKTPPDTFAPRCGQHRRFIVAAVEDFTDLSIMVNAIRKLSRPIPSDETSVATPDEERILVIVNPHSGKKTGINMYDTILRPMLEQAGIAHDCLVTTHANHAEERMEKQSSTSDFRDISKYSGMVLIGGDGTIHEVLQGIHQRTDRDTILQRLKLGTIGGGTSNGFSASLAYASKVSVSI